MLPEKKPLFQKLFRKFDLARDGKGVDKNEDTRPTFKRFFVLLWRKKGQIFSLNLMMILMIVPILAGLFLYGWTQTSSTLSVPIQNSISFSPLFGASVSETTPTSTLLLGLYGTQSTVLNFSSPFIAVYIALGVILLLTWGWLNVGSFYVARGLVRGDPVFVWSDFFYAVRRNLWSGLLFGMADIAVIGLLVFDYMTLNGNLTTFFEYLMFFTVFAIALLYALMRPYLYLMLITFDIKPRKMLKNALIFSVLGIKRNILVLFGIVLLVVLSAVLMILFLPVGVAVTIILPFLYLLGVSAFAQVFAAYPIIQKYMIDPVSPPKTEGED